MIDRDRDAVAAVSIFEALMRCLMPTDVMSHVDECLKCGGLPRLATRSVVEGWTVYFWVSFCFMLMVRLIITGSCRSMEKSIIFRKSRPPEVHCLQDYVYCAVLIVFSC